MTKKITINERPVPFTPKNLAWDTEVLFYKPGREGNDMDYSAGKGNCSKREVREISDTLKHFGITLKVSGGKTETEINTHERGEMQVKTEVKKNGNKWKVEVTTTFRVDSTQTFRRLSESGGFHVFSYEDPTYCRKIGIRTSIPPSECMKRGLHPWGLFAIGAMPPGLAKHLRKFRVNPTKPPKGVHISEGFTVIYADELHESTIQKLKHGGEPQRICNTPQKVNIADAPGKKLPPHRRR